MVSKLGDESSPEALRVITEVRHAVLSGGPVVQVTLDVLAAKSVLGHSRTKALLLLIMSLEAQTHGQEARSNHFLGQAEATLA
jgi:hypothetical protein